VLLELLLLLLVMQQVMVRGKVTGMVRVMQLLLLVMGWG
jgi:hypothetical protein